MSLVKIYSIIFLISLIFIVIIFEIYSSYRKDLFPSYGWQTDNIMKNKIKKCNHEKNIGIFGDSFVFDLVVKHFDLFATKHGSMKP